MSDGNFNRALLPSTPYASGVKMGYQQAKTKAVASLAALLNEHCPTLSSEEREAMIAKFKAGF